MYSLSVDPFFVLGHSLSAGQAYLRAATYYRASLHRHPDPFDPEVKAMAEKEVEVYKKFLALTKYPCESVAIPYENTTLPGYLCINPNVQGPAPTIMFNEGKDGWAEDGKFIVDAAMTRGYNVLLWDGPGMGKTIRIQGLVFRHDWENVVTPIIDYLVTIPKVDPKQIAMITLSLGGFLGPRAALFEKRLRGLVANPGVLNWYKVYTDVLNSMDPNLLSLLDADPAAFDEQILGMMQFSDFLDWGMRDSCWHHGADPNKPSELIFEIRKFNIEGMLGNFTTPILVVDAEAEERGQAMELYSALPETVDKTYTFFTSQEAAQFHDQPGATAIMSARIMDWLDDRFVESATLTSGSGVFSFHASFAFIGIVVGFILL